MPRIKKSERALFFLRGEIERELLIVEAATRDALDVLSRDQKSGSAEFIRGRVTIAAKSLRTVLAQLGFCTVGQEHYLGKLRKIKLLDGKDI